MRPWGQNKYCTGSFTVACCVLIAQLSNAADFQRGFHRQVSMWMSPCTLLRVLTSAGDLRLKGKDKTHRPPRKHSGAFTAVSTIGASEQVSSGSALWLSRYRRLCLFSGRRAAERSWRRCARIKTHFQRAWASSFKSLSLTLGERTPLSTAEEDR